MPDTLLTLLKSTIVPSWGEVLITLAVVPAILLPLERLFPARRDLKHQRASVIVNLSFWFFNPLLMQIISKVAVGAAVVGLCLLLRWEIGASLLDGYGPLSRQPLWLQAIQILLIADFIDYWTHRWFHVTRAWRFHAVHHSPQEMTCLASARMHPVNDFITRICQVVPIMLLGYSAKAALMVVPYLVFFVILLHSNLNWDFGPLRWVFVSPLYHRWHHTKDEEGLDKNFAALFPIWDVMFGTAHFPRREPKTFGVNHNPPPESFLGLLVYPFRRLTLQHPTESEAQATADGASSLDPERVGQQRPG